MAQFQVKLGDKWANYDKDEDKILKRAFQAGFPNARFALRGQRYEYDFKKMVQRNVETGKERQIRAPHKWTQPSKPLIPKGRSTTVTVPKGPGGKPPNFVKLPHPDQKGAFFDVEIPAGAKVGQVLLVPVPDLPVGGIPAEAPTPAPSAPPAEPSAAATEEEKKKGGWSTGAKVAAGVAGTAAVGGLVVGGVLLGEHVADVGWDAAGADIAGAAGDAGEAVVGAAETAGEAIAGAAEDAGEWISGAAEDAGDFIMDLF